VADHRATGGAGEPAVGEQRDVVLVALADDGRGDTEHLSHPWAAPGTLVSDDDDVSGLNAALLDVRHGSLL
jgi:hypothetical protein